MLRGGSRIESVAERFGRLLVTGRAADQHKWGRVLDVSRQRVYQLLKERGLTRKEVDCG